MVPLAVDEIQDSFLHPSQAKERHLKSYINFAFERQVKMKNAYHMEMPKIDN